MGEIYTLITGASSGFGRSIAQKLAPARKLILAGRNTEKLEAVRQTCEAPERHLLWVRDLSQIDRVGEDLASWLSTKDIGVDHFIHSAGITGDLIARAVEMSVVSRVFNVNLFSAMEIIRPLVQKRVNKGALRSITLISSISGKLGGKAISIYSASKGAVNALTRALAVELAPAIRVNAVLPGYIETEMTKASFTHPEFVEFLKATYPLGLGRPDDVADAVEFLASDRARWITGQEIIVDGGRSIS